MKLAVFDLDGTLVNSAPDLAACINMVRAELELPPLTVAEVAGKLGCGVRDLLRKSLPELENPDMDRIVKMMQGFYSEHLTDTTSLYRGVEETLRALHDGGVKIALVTNKEVGAATKILQALKVDIWFDNIIGGDSGFAMKPAPDALLALKSKYSVADGCCWMIGDHHTDLGAGREAGFTRIFCTYGFGICGDEVPDFKVDSFPEIMPLIGER